MIKRVPAALAIQPSGIYAYIDKLICWTKGPLSPAEIAELKHNSKYTEFRRNGEPYHNGKNVVVAMHPYSDLRQRITLFQPEEGALKVLLPLKPRLTNLESALDRTLRVADEKEQLHEMLRQCSVIPRRGKQTVFCYGGRSGTQYSAARASPVIHAQYSDKPCRVTGEIHCVHQEVRINGHRALVRAGISSIETLLTIDWRKFWADRLKLFSVDPRRLGLIYHRHHLGTKRRGPWLTKYGVPNCDMDYLVGTRLLRAHDLSLQRLIDANPQLKIRRLLEPISVDHLLPA